MTKYQNEYVIFSFVFKPERLDNAVNSLLNHMKICHSLGKPQKTVVFRRRPGKSFFKSESASTLKNFSFLFE